MKVFVVTGDCDWTDTGEFICCIRLDKNKAIQEAKKLSEYNRDVTYDVIEYDTDEPPTNH